NPTGDPKGFVIRDLLRSIFMHDEFYSAQAKTSSVKNPCEFMFHAIRATKSKTNGKILPDHLEAMGMDLFDPPGVNGWTHGLPWVSSGNFLARINFAQALAAGRDGDLKRTPGRRSSTTSRGRRTSSTRTRSSARSAGRWCSRSRCRSSRSTEARRTSH